MAQEEEKVLQNGESGNQEGGTDNNTYIEAIKEMKKNYVPRGDYEKVKDENKKLLDSLIEGKQIEQPHIEEKVDIDKLRKELYFSDKSLSNLEYITKTLQLRKATMDLGKQDPFLPTGKSVPLTQEDYIGAEKVATILEECVKIADGDEYVFNNEFQRRIVDVPTMRPGKRR